LLTFSLLETEGASMLRTHFMEAVESGRSVSVRPRMNSLVMADS